MSYTTVFFYRIHQDSQDYGGDDQHMVSRVFFAIERDGAPVTATYADLKQTVGDDFESGRIEVGRPAGYKGPWNHGAFAAGAEKYFRDAVGAAGRAIRIQGGRAIRMRDNVFYGAGHVEFETDESSSGGW